MIKHQPHPAAFFGHQTIGLLGLAREGRSSYRYLRSIAPELTIWAVDDKPLAELDPVWQTWLQHDTHLRFFTTAEWLESNLEVDLVVRTPGLPLHHPLVHSQQLRSADWTTNMELFFEAIDDWKSRLNRPVTTIGITGTKGKSTTTALVHHVLKSAGFNALLGGNIGQPALELLTTPLPSSTDPVYVVLEMSCHQLAELHYSPTIAIIQNVVPEHLDYYPDFETYLSAKSAISRFQTKTDWVIFNQKHTNARGLAELSAAQAQTFTIGVDTSCVATVHDGFFWLHDQKVINTASLPLVGEHNWENILPSVVIANLFHISVTQLATSLQSFHGLPHRLERVKTLDGVSYYNDSLSTVPEAAQAALTAFPDIPKVLIAGGFERHQDFSALAETILQSKVVLVILFAPTGHRLWTAIEQVAQQKNLPLPERAVANTMSEAVQAAQRGLDSTGVVLLSPASPSFGTFTDYADRGNQFKAAVELLQPK